MNKTNVENKVGGNSFKFMSSPLPSEPIPKVIPANKRKAEFALTMLFTQLLLVNGYEITKIELNENDENKGADTIIRVNGKEKGIQLTKLVLNDLLKRKDVGEKRSLKISKLITENLKIDFKLNIFIYPPKHNENEIPKNRAKLDKSLATEIGEGIKSNLKSLRNSTKPIFITIEKENLKEITSSISLNPIQKGHHPIFPGQNNIFVNFEIDNNFFDDEDVLKEIDTMYNRKNNGESEFLLIWADRFELLYQEEKIFKLIEEKFSESSFEEVFFLTFFNRIDLFNKSIKIKKVEKHGS